MARFILLLLVLALAASYSRQGAAFAVGWDDDDLPQRQAAMKDALRARSAESVQRAMAFMNSELEPLRPIFKAIHKMPENTPAEIRAKEKAQAASHELLARHLGSLIPGGSVTVQIADL